MALPERFQEHPASVGETYAEHSRVAGHFAWELAKASVAAGVHAVLPWCFERTASTKIQLLHHEMTSGNRSALRLTETELRAAS